MEGTSVGVPRKLTSKQILFVKELVHNEGKITATEAAINAGYPEATARSKASMLQNPKYYPLVVDYARQVREEVQQKYNVDIYRHFKELQKIIKHGKLDQLTEEELDEKIGELMREMKIVDGELIDDAKKIN